MGDMRTNELDGVCYLVVFPLNAALIEEEEHEANDNRNEDRYNGHDNLKSVPLGAIAFF
jgi:hypothetical protein